MKSIDDLNKIITQLVRIRDRMQAVSESGLSAAALAEMAGKADAAIQARAAELATWTAANGVPE